MIAPLLSISQSGYPKVIINGSDTIVAVTFEQMERLNIVKVERDYYAEFSDSLQSLLTAKNLAFVSLQQAKTALLTEVELNGKLIREQAAFTKDLKAELKELGIKLKWLRKVNRVLLIYSISATILLILLV